MKGYQRDLKPWDVGSETRAITPARKKGNTTPLATLLRRVSAPASSPPHTLLRSVANEAVRNFLARVIWPTCVWCCSTPPNRFMSGERRKRGSHPNVFSRTATRKDQQP